MDWQKYSGQVEGAYPPNVPSVSGTSSNTVDRPGPIDNSDIIETGEENKDDPQISRMLEEGREYVLVPEEVWDKLLKW